jgi:hypothetical protein
VVLAGILLAVGSGLYASHHLGVNTDTDQVFGLDLGLEPRTRAGLRLLSVQVSPSNLIAGT